MIIIIPGIGPRRIPDGTSQAKIDQIMAAANAKLAKVTLYNEWRSPDKLAEIDAYLVSVGFDPPTMEAATLARQRDRVRLWKSGQISEEAVVPPLNRDELL